MVKWLSLRMALSNDACDTDKAEDKEHKPRGNINGSDEPEREEVERFVAVLPFSRIIIGLIFFVHPIGPYNKPSQHKTVQEHLCR